MKNSTGSVIMATSSSLNSNNSRVRTGHSSNETTWMIRIKNQISLKQHCNRKPFTRLHSSLIHRIPSFDKNYTLRSSFASLLCVTSTRIACQSLSIQDGKSPEDSPNNCIANNSSFLHCKLPITSSLRSHQLIKEGLWSFQTQEKTCSLRSVHQTHLQSLPNSRPTPNPSIPSSFLHD